jgi:hypothetical protein
MNSQPAREGVGLAYLIGILGSFLIIAALVWAMQRYTQPPRFGRWQTVFRVHGWARDSEEHSAGFHSLAGDVLLGTVRMFDVPRPSSRLRRFLEIVFPEAEPLPVHYV